MTPLAGLLGVTAGELLSGQRNGGAAPAGGEAPLDSVLAYAQRAAGGKIASLRSTLAAAFSLLLLLGALVCLICDLALSGGLSWSPIPLCSILLAWLVLIPLVRYGRKGITGALAALSLFILPFLYVMSRLTGSGLVFSIGARVCPFSLAYLWGVYLLFRGLGERRLLAAAFSLLLAAPLCAAIEIGVSSVLSIPPFDRWDILSAAVLLAAAAALFFADKLRKN